MKVTSRRVWPAIFSGHLHSSCGIWMVQPGIFQFRWLSSKLWLSVVIAERCRTSPGHKKMKITLSVRKRGACPKLRFSWHCFRASHTRAELHAGSTNHVRTSTSCEVNWSAKEPAKGDSGISERWKLYSPARTLLVFAVHYCPGGVSGRRKVVLRDSSFFFSFFLPSTLPSFFYSLKKRFTIHSSINGNFSLTVSATGDAGSSGIFRLHSERLRARSVQ